MSINWIWSSKDSAGVEPRIGEQLVSIDNARLRMRNPWVANSAQMGKIYASVLIGGTAAATLFFLSEVYGKPRLDYGFLISVALVIAFISLMLGVSVRVIKNESDFLFDRSTKRVFYRGRGRVIAGDWDSTVGGQQSKVEFTGKSVVVMHSLLLRMQAESSSLDGVTSLPVSLFVSIESNAPTEPFEIYIAQVWEFIRIFMDEGPDKLPEPGESSWWNSPNLRICLTPAQALRHYVPWRTGEPNEMQGKSNWLLPLWLISFPYNMFCALCWYAVCRVLKVRGMPPPVHVMGSEYRERVPDSKVKKSPSTNRGA